jgi:hypothetical protein
MRIAGARSECATGSAVQAAGVTTLRDGPRAGVPVQLKLLQELFDGVGERNRRLAGHCSMLTRNFSKFRL